MTKSQRITVRIKKAKDGRTALSCVRADGTTTWQRQEGGQAAFFPRHDLTHYAVETTLGISDGFFGLVASGWDFSDFGHPWPRGPLPLQGNVTEVIVALFDLERATGEHTSAEEINRKVAEYCADKGLPEQQPITEEAVARVRHKRSELFSKWESVSPGDSIELPFDL
jgi:2-polyprenyl-6-methoxyphenol hydroxylase-like FAD-dependent oxidoreductase